VLTSAPVLQAPPVQRQTMPLLVGLPPGSAWQPTPTRPDCTCQQSCCTLKQRLPHGRQQTRSALVPADPPPSKAQCRRSRNAIMQWATPSPPAFAMQAICPPHNFPFHSPGAVKPLSTSCQSSQTSMNARASPRPTSAVLAVHSSPGALQLQSPSCRQAPLPQLAAEWRGGWTPISQGCPPPAPAGCKCNPQRPALSRCSVFLLVRCVCALPQPDWLLLLLLLPKRGRRVGVTEAPRRSTSQRQLFDNSSAA
jgi:hypothetical protein